MCCQHCLFSESGEFCVYIYIYTVTINVKMLKASFVSKELEHFMAFFPPSTAIIFILLFLSDANL